MNVTIYDKNGDEYRGKVHIIPGDGNCLFASIAAQLSYLEHVTHLNLRSMVCAYMENNQERFSNFFDQPFDAYIANMRRPSVWGGQPEMQASK